MNTYRVLLTDDDVWLIKKALLAAASMEDAEAVSPQVLADRLRKNEHATDLAKRLPGRPTYSYKGKP